MLIILQQLKTIKMEENKNMTYMKIFVGIVYVALIVLIAMFASG